MCYFLNNFSKKNCVKENYCFRVEQLDPFYFEPKENTF